MMHRLALAALPLATCIAVPAMAQTASTPAMAPSSAPTRPQRDANGCRAENAGDPAVTVRIDLSGALSMQASAKNWSFAADVSYPIRIRPVGEPILNSDAPGNEVTIDAQGLVDGKGRSGIAFPIKGAMYLTLIRPQLALYRDGEAKPFALIDNPYAGGSAAMRACLIEAAKGDSGSGKPVVTKAKVESFSILESDYPAAALQAKEQGRTAVRLSVSAHGVARDCTVVESSGSATLDKATCSLLLRRARFSSPALDADGQPTESVVPASSTWRLPS